MYSRSLIYSRKKCRTRTASLRNTSINWIFLERLLIQIISKPFITKKIQNKAKHLTRNNIKATSIKKTSMSNPFESLIYIKCYSLSSPKFMKSFSNFIRQKCQRICSRSRRPEIILEIRQKTKFLHAINKPIISKFFRDFTNQINKTSRTVTFSHRPLPNIL